MSYLPHEIDPETLHIAVNAPLLEHLAEGVHVAVGLARARNKVVLIHHIREEGLLDPTGALITSTDSIVFRDHDPAFFAKREIQCPREADAQWEAQHDEARPFPSIIVQPTGAIAVSKPNLCDSCVFRLARATTGSCAFRQFTPLPNEVL